MENDGAWRSFLCEMEELLGDGYPAYLASFSQPWNRGLRVNTGKVSVGQLTRLLEQMWAQCAEPGEGAPLLAPIPWISNGAYHDPGWAASKDPYYYAGLYYLQEPSAMTPASRLPVEPGDKVLDLCAAPGGKATELGVRLQGKGMLFANDLSNSRAKALLKNLELFGIPNICVTSESPEKLAQTLPGFFDKILVDAPCSGEGMFRKEPDMIKDWAEHGPSYYAPIQRDILSQAVELLKPGGYLLYSTCTFSKKEDEENVVWLLEHFPEMELVPLELFPGASDGMGLSGVLRLFPHKIKGEGHFLALLRKKGCAGGAGEAFSEKPFEKEQGIDKRKGRRGTSPTAAPSQKGPMADGLTEFLADLSDDLPIKKEPRRIRLLQDKLYFLPEGFPEGAKLRYLRTGLYLGELKRGRFEPSQALAMALRPEDHAHPIRFSHGDERVIRYLKGETVLFDEQEEGAGREGKKDDGRTGWRLICLEDFPLGWAKKSGGTLKNKYYPGWRYQ